MKRKNPIQTTWIEEEPENRIRVVCGGKVMYFTPEQYKYRRRSWDLLGSDPSKKLEKK